MSNEDNDHNNKLTIIFVGDAGVSTGFAACTHAACDALHAAGHEVHVLGINFYSDLHVNSPWPYPIYTCLHPYDGGSDGYGQRRLPHLVTRINPDIIVLLCDPWMVRGYHHLLTQHVDELKADESLPKDYMLPPMIAWLAVDGENQEGDDLNGIIDHVIMWTKFGVDMLKKGGYTGTISIVPLGVNSDLFTPKDKAESRTMLFGDQLGDDDFIVGMVGRNQPRKNIIGAMEGWSKFVHTVKHNRAIGERFPRLYLHMAPTGEAAYNVPELARYFNIKDHVLIGDQNIGHGISPLAMPYVYSSFDVLLITSWGEGWSLPVIEALACGVPCVVPDNSAFQIGSGWCSGGVVRVPCKDAIPCAPQNSKHGCWTIGKLIDTSVLAATLEGFYNRDGIAIESMTTGMETARSLTWKNTGELFVKEVESFMNDYTPKPFEVKTVSTAAPVYG